MKGECHKFIDLFAGIGGFHLALKERGLECVFASEWDKHAAWAYEQNYGMKPAGDITKIDAADIPAMDVICGGFPCQAFSLANNNARGMEEARGTLFFDICRIAEHHKPKLLLLENVPRIVSFDDGKVLDTIYRTLDSIGYKVTHHILNAALYGVATARKRVYFVAIRKDLDWVSNCPPPTYERACVADYLRHDLDTKHLERPIEDFIFREHKPQPANAEGTKLLGRHKKATRAKGPQGNRVYDPNGALPAQTCSSQEQILAPERVGKHKSGKNQGYNVYSTDKPGPTIAARGGGTFCQGEGYLVPKQIGRKPTGPRKYHTGPAANRVYASDHPGPTFTCDKRTQAGSYLVPETDGKPKQICVSKKNPGSIGYRGYDIEGPAVTFQAEAGGMFTKTGGYFVPDLVADYHKHKGKQGCRVYSEDTPANTLMTSNGKNDNFHIQGVVRRLHIEEAKCVQGFPPEHILSKGDQGYRQVGNSVIPKMVGLVFDNIVPAGKATGQGDLDGI